MRALGGNDERSPDERLAEVNAMQEAAGLYAEVKVLEQPCGCVSLLSGVLGMRCGSF